MDHTGTNLHTNPKPRAITVIPARYDSSRLPGKPLLEIAGRPMILWVIERALGAKNVERVIVATDDRRILNAVQAAGYEALMTRSDHASGTDRVAEVAARVKDVDIIVNLQADEPMICPETLDRAIEALVAEEGLTQEGEETRDCPQGSRDPSQSQTEGASIVTAWEPIEIAADVLNPDLVKVVLDSEDRAVYFSRAPIPYPRDAVKRHGTLRAALDNERDLVAQFRKHTGLYVYRPETLLEFASWPQSDLERAEKLEQLRAFAHGIKIRVIQASKPSIGVDTIEDLERVRTLIERDALAL